MLQIFQTKDGKHFSDKAEAARHEEELRKPLVVEAFKAFTDNADLIQWTMENYDEIGSCFETGSVKRVTKKDKQALREALDSVKDIENAEWLTVNAEAILGSFAWPRVKRLTEEEKKAFVKKNLLNITENNEEVSEWVIENKDKIDEAMEAGIEKKVMNEASLSGLQKYRAMMAEKKAAEAAAAAAAA
jgi:hypothetical protein